MKSLSFSLTLSLSLSALLAACANPEATKAPVPPPTIARPGATVISVTQDDSGASVTLEPGQGLVIGLAINATAGQEWSQVDPGVGVGVLTLTSSNFERALRNTNVEESAGSTVWRFRAQAPGTTTLRFELRRPRSLQAASQTAVYNVTVK